MWHVEPRMPLVRPATSTVRKNCRHTACRPLPLWLRPPDRSPSVSSHPPLLCSQDPSSTAKQKRLREIKSTAESHTAGRQAAGPASAHSTERTALSDLRVLLIHSGSQATVSSPLKPGARIRLYRLLKTRQDLISSQEKDSGDWARSQEPLALSLAVWELSVAYDHGCDAALQSVPDSGLGPCTGDGASEWVPHSPGPFHACLAPPYVSWVGKRVKLASRSTWKLEPFRRVAPQRGQGPRVRQSLEPGAGATGMIAG